MQKSELSLVRENLYRMIEKTERIVSDSATSVNTLKNIGGPEILERINNSNGKIDDLSSNLADSNSKNN